MNYTPIQLKLPVDMERIIKINDPVYSFSEVMAHIDLNKYFVEKEHETGRPRYDREKILKIVLFAFMEFGYCSLRFIEKLCLTDIRFIWILDEDKAPSHAKSSLVPSAKDPQEIAKFPGGVVDIPFLHTKKYSTS